MANDIVSGQSNDLLTEKDFDDIVQMTIMAMMISMIVVSILPTLSFAQASESQAAAQSYLGAVDARTLHANTTVKFINLVGDPPYNAWIAADFQNIGPDVAYIGINTPGPWIALAAPDPSVIGSGRSGTVDLSGATKRIEVIFYKANPGETADIDVIGKY